MPYGTASKFVDVGNCGEASGYADMNDEKNHIYVRAQLEKSARLKKGVIPLHSWTQVLMAKKT